MRTKTFMPILLGKPRFLSPAQMRVRVANNLFQIHDSFQQCHVLQKSGAFVPRYAPNPRGHHSATAKHGRNATAPPKTSPITGAPKDAMTAPTMRPAMMAVGITTAATKYFMAVSCHGAHPVCASVRFPSSKITG